MFLAGCIGLGLAQPVVYAVPAKPLSPLEAEAERQREKAWTRTMAEIDARKAMLDSQKRLLKPAYWTRLQKQLTTRSAELTKLKTQKGWPTRLELATGASEFMWRVRNDKGVCFIVGTVPLVLPDFYPLPREIYQALSSSDTVLLDMPSSKAASGNLSGGDSLSKHLSKETNSRLSAYLAEIGQPREYFEKKQPWMVAKMLETTELQRLGMRSESGLDKHFLRRAQQSGKKFVTLDAADEKHNILNGLSNKEQEQYLQLALLELRGKENQLDRLTDCWWKGEPQAMERTLNAYSKAHPELAELQKTVVSTRTDSMLNQVEGLLNKGGSYFIVVDSANLVGDEGLLKGLKNKGMEVMQASAGLNLAVEPKKQVEPPKVVANAASGTSGGGNAQKPAEATTPVATKASVVAEKPAEVSKEFSQIKDAQALMKQLETLVKSFYPRATIKLTEDRLQFQFKIQKFQSNGLLVDAPRLDGILGEVTIVPSVYSGAKALPSYTNEQLYTELLMGPHSQAKDSHLLARLVYPPNAPSDFVNQFKSLINCYPRF